MDNYKMVKIPSRMAKVFGTIPKGREDMYNLMLFPLEGNLLKLYRRDRKGTGRDAIDAIRICLLKIDGYLNEIEYDFNNFITDNNKPFVDGLLAGFDPFTNPEIYDVAIDFVDLNSKEDLNKYFQDPVRCLLRIEKSMKLWTQEFGANGYFSFIESQIGSIVERDEKMNYTINFGESEKLQELIDFEEE